MNEARRFIRYLIPGIVCVVELLLFFVVSAPSNTINLVQNNIFKDTSGTALFGSAFLGLGGLGYLLATIYHGMSKVPIFRHPNHRRFLLDSINSGLIVLRRYRDGARIPRVEYEQFDRIDAWCVLGAYYHSRIYKIKFKEAHGRIESINDILHGLGATMAGTIIITIVWGVINYCILCKCLRWWDLLLPVIFNVVIIWNYYRTAVEAARIIDGITAQFITNEVSTGGQIDLFI